MTTFPKNTDIVVRFEPASTVWTFEPITDEAREWIVESISFDDWQWVGNALGVDHRLADEILQIMIDDGFRVYHPTYGFAGPL